MIILIKNSNNQFQYLNTFWYMFTDLKKVNNLCLMITDVASTFRHTFYYQLNLDEHYLLIQICKDLQIESEYQFNLQVGGFCQDNYLQKFFEQINNCPTLEKFLNQ